MWNYFLPAPLILEKVEIPNYFKLSELILRAINKRRKELTSALEKVLPSDIRAALDELFIQRATLEGEPIPSKLPPTSCHNQPNRKR